ncbi:MAG: iron-sulfur cluster-binding domain-containing protein, partial [Nocardioides sp.]|nr:iron-sulfur cluster-binding domain-containing protein [Nocardioides sp.]
ARCSSLSSTLGEPAPMPSTVKRTAEGYASNWLCENIRAGDTLRVLPPSGIFSPKDLDADLLLFAGGSGVTPVISIARTALAKGSGKVVVFYANRDEKSVIFADEWARLAVENPDRLIVVHWLESVQGLPTQEQLQAFAGHFSSFDSFCCGPAPFMKNVSLALRELGFPRARRHQEKFISLGGNPFGDLAGIAEAEHEIQDAEATEEDAPAEGGPQGPVKVEVELDGVEHTFDDWQPGTKLLDFLESKGINAPFSCREGQCSACAVRIVEGEVKLLHDEVLDEEDRADGIRLACQAVPVTDTVKVTYH